MQNYIEVIALIPIGMFFGFAALFLKDIIRAHKQVNDCSYKSSNTDVQTCEEAKRRGIEFAEKILRNYPETGAESLRRTVVERRDTSIPGDSCFADGIEEVLYNVATMGRSNDR